MYSVVLSAEAAEIYAAADLPLARKLKRCFESLARNPRQGNNIKKLKGRLAGSYRYRLGDYRVVYRIDDDRIVVTVITIAHRRDVYD